MKTFLGSGYLCAHKNQYISELSIMLPPSGTYQHFRVYKSITYFDFQSLMFVAMLRIWSLKMNRNMNLKRSGEMFNKLKTFKINPTHEITKKKKQSAGISEMWRTSNKILNDYTSSTSVTWICYLKIFLFVNLWNLNHFDGGQMAQNNNILEL